MKSIRVYLVAVIISVVCLSNFIAALYGYERSSQAADALVDRQILEKSQSLLLLADNQVALPQKLFRHDTLYQVWKNGQLIYRSDNAPDTRLIHAGDGFHFVSFNGLRWRALLNTSPEKSQHIVVAERFDIYSMLSEEIVLRAILPIIWILPLVALLVWVIIGLGLKPLSRLAGLLDTRKIDNFDALNSSYYPSELNIIVDSLNDLFARLQSAFNREKRFSADAAHELRTPLSALKISLHNLKATQSSVLEVENLEASIDRMGQTIEQLLALHSVSADDLKAKQESCDMHTITQTVIANCYPFIEQKAQEIELEGESALVRGNHFALAMMLRNLIDNASKYTPDRGTIHVSISNDTSGVVVCVEDSGPGIPAAQRQRVTDRFYRIGGDRHASGVIGSGLGLSIVAHVVKSHHGSMTLAKAKKLGGLSVTVVLPTTRGDQ